MFSPSKYKDNLLNVPKSAQSNKRLQTPSNSLCKFMTWCIMIHSLMISWYFMIHVMGDVRSCWSLKTVSQLSCSLIFDRSSSASICHTASWSSSWSTPAARASLYASCLARRQCEKHVTEIPLLSVNGVFHHMLNLRLSFTAENRCPSNHWDWSRPLPIEPVDWIDLHRTILHKTRLIPECRRAACALDFRSLSSATSNFELPHSERNERMLFRTNTAYQRCSSW